MVVCGTQGLLHHPADPYYTNKGFRIVKVRTADDDPPSDMSEHHHYSFSLMLKLFDELKTLHKPNSEIYSQLLRVPKPTLLPPGRPASSHHPNVCGRVCVCVSLRVCGCVWC